MVFMVAFTTASMAYAYTYYPGMKTAEEPIASTKVVMDNAKAKGLSREENRKILSSQYGQVKKALENPGVYAWGSNKYCVVDFESNDTVVKIPRRLHFFDGVLLRDLKLDEQSGAAITENGDLVQWGKGFSETSFKPTRTLTGKNLLSVCMSRDRIIALSSDGSVYSLPISKADQETGPKQREAAWLPFHSSISSLSYRQLRPNLGLGEWITALSGGLEHVLLLSSAGRVFSASAATEDFPSKGQLGIPGLNWLTRPQGPVDSCHEIKSLREYKVTQIASGDYHSLVLDKDGRVFVFGDNSFGQLGIQFDVTSPFKDTPNLLSLKSLYPSKDGIPKATGIAAGGFNSFLTVDVQRPATPRDEKLSVKDICNITADTWAFGKGIYGTLGNGRWTHLQDTPTKVKSLSNLLEYNDRSQRISPIRLHGISVGTTHAAAILGNQTHLNLSEKSNESLTDTNWGADVFWWGGNEYFQLGTGKRNNIPVPTYINAPVDIDNIADGDLNRNTRFQIIPHYKGKVNGRKVAFEQRVECGRNVSAVYSAV